MVRSGLFIEACAILTSGLMATGCSSLSCLMTGTAFEDAEDDSDMKGLKNIASLKSGGSIRLHTVTGDTLEGTYQGLEPRPWDEYRTELGHVAHSQMAGLFPPNWNEKIRIVTDQHGITGVVEGGFAGFDPACIYVHTVDRSTIEKVDVGIVTAIVDTLRRIVPGDSVRSIVADGRVPCLSEMIIAMGDSMCRIPLQDIKDIGIPGGHHALTGLATGVVIGAVIVVVIIAIALHELSHTPMLEGGW